MSAPPSPYLRRRVMVVAQQLRRRAPGGIGTYTRGLLAGLAGATAPDAFGVRALLSRGPDPGLPVPAVRLALPASVLTRVWDAGVPAGRHVLDDGERVHTTSLLVPPFGPARTSVFVHDLLWRAHPEAYPAAGRRWHDAALARALRRADLLLCPSTATADALLAEGAPAHRIHVVDEGTDHLALHPPTAPTCLLAVATIEPRKNLARLVEAYARIRTRLPEPWPLRIVGAAGWGDGAPPRTDGVELLGAVDDDRLGQLYAQARLVAYVPLAEGFGLPPLEAMRAGAPVVASAVPAVRSGACVVDPLDVDAIAAALLRVATDDAVRAELIAAGEREVRGRTWAASAAAHTSAWGAR